MVLMEKALSISQKKNLDLGAYKTQSNSIKKALKIYSELVGDINNILTCQVQSVRTQLQYIVREEKKYNVELYNMEPFAGPATYVDMGINLYNMESSQ